MAREKDILWFSSAGRCPVTVGPDFTETGALSDPRRFSVLTRHVEEHQLFPWCLQVPPLAVGLFRSDTFGSTVTLGVCHKQSGQTGKWLSVYSKSELYMSHTCFWTLSMTLVIMVCYYNKISSMTRQITKHNSNPNCIYCSCLCVDGGYSRLSDINVRVFNRSPILHSHQSVLI